MAAQSRRGRRLCPSPRRTTFPEPMRSSPREIWPWAVDKKIWAGGIPEQVPWISGVLAPADATIVSAPADDRWRQRWCGTLYLDAATTRKVPLTPTLALRLSPSGCLKHAAITHPE